MLPRSWLPSRRIRRTYLATTKLGLEAEHEAERSIDLVGLGKLLSNLRLGDGTSAGVQHIHHLIWAARQRHNREIEK